MWRAVFAFAALGMVGPVACLVFGFHNLAVGPVGFELCFSEIGLHALDQGARNDDTLLVARSAVLECEMAVIAPAVSTGDQRDPCVVAVEKNCRATIHAGPEGARPG
jgi:hypothetical protein